jgi:dihydrolipoamide dehydrogenase
MEKYDLCVIGAGPSGYAAAMRAIDFKKKVLLIEKKRLGGAGIHHGALSSKTWWELSREMRKLIKQSQVFNFPQPVISFQAMKSKVLGATQRKEDLLQHHMDNVNLCVHEELFHYKKGVARIVSPQQVEIKTFDGIETIEAEHIIIATGSRPRYLDHIPIDEKHIITSDSIDKLVKWPESMVILGAGVIGCEFATIFSNFGRTKVNIIDKGDRILPFEDEDVVRVIEKNLEDRGVLIHRNSRLIEMKVEDGEVVYTLEYTDGSKELFRVEKAIVSVGRVPNYEDIVDPSLGLKVSPRGIENDLTQTNIPSIYAVGDITADMSLVNVGELEGRYAVEKIFATPKRELVYENIATIMFMAPEVAGVGLNEIAAQKQGLDYKVVTLDYRCISRAIAMRKTEGFIKILVSNDSDMKVLGMRVIGVQASSAIEAVALLIYMNKGIEELMELIHPHPSIIEGIQECVRMLLNKSILKPCVLRDDMTCRSYQDGEYSNLQF